MSPRPPSSQRGYGQDWPEVRARILAEWAIPLDFAAEHRIDIDHFPCWPSLGRDHSRYILLPGPARGARAEDPAAGGARAYRRVEAGGPAPGELFADIDMAQRVPLSAVLEAFKW